MIITLTGCSYKIVRNYPYPNKQEEVLNNYNDPKIVKRKNLFGLNVQYLGTIKLDDKGLTINCSEDKAIFVLKSEAHKLNSNLINITDESYPEISTCYRCIADFYYVPNNKNTSEIIEKPNRSVIKYDSIRILNWNYFHINDTIKIPYTFFTNIEVMSIGASYWTGDYKGFKTQGVFYNDVSVINSNSKNDSTLQNIQLLFDLTQLYAKKLERFLNSRKFNMNNKQEVQKTLNQFINELYSEQRRFKNETNYGKNGQIQLEWRNRIKSELDQYNK